MRNEKISSKRLELYITDNSRARWCRKTLFKKYLRSAVFVFEDYLFKKVSKIPFSGMCRETQAVELHLCLCGEQMMKRLNKEFRNKDRSTDVLSFPLVEGLRSERPLFPLVNLGDIFVSRNHALKQSRDFNLEIEQEVLHLLVHGFVHLCGFDHEISLKEQKLMEEIEKRLIEKIAKHMKGE